MGASWEEECVGRRFEYWTDDYPLFDIPNGIGRCIIRAGTDLVIVRGCLPNFLGGFINAQRAIAAFTSRNAQVVPLQGAPLRLVELGLDKP